MPCIAGQYSPNVGPIIQIAIAQPSAIQAGSSLVLGQNAHMYSALMDTGASATCISAKVVADVALAPTGKVQMAGAHGTHAVNTYQFAVGFVLGVRQSTAGQVTTDFALRQLDGAEWDSGGCAFDVLLGRDVLCAGTFSLSFDGHYLLAF